MSTDTSLLVEIDSTVQDGVLASPINSETAESTWDIEKLLGTPQVSVIRGDKATYDEPWIKVAPDFFVKKSEYQRRFAEVDLDYYRQRMTPKLFTAFVRHMGVVPGSPGLDVVELTTLPDL